MNINPSQVKRLAAETLLQRRAMRERLAPFIKRVFKTVDPGAVYRHNWHIDLISEYLEACSKQQIRRLILNVPPRHLKSIAVSVAWPAWLLGKNPSEQIVAASYAASLSLKHSVDCRMVIQSPWYKATFPDVALAGDMNMKSEFMTTMAGHRTAVSVGGAVTGKGGNFLITDDPVNPEQAMSVAERTTANDWFDQTYSTRLNDEKRGVMVVIMQRLHTEDLTGHLLKKGGWEHISIPCEAEKKTIIDFGSVHVVREEGELLQPERMGPEEVAAKKLALGSYGWAGQYQQRPAPLEGGLIKLHWFKRYSVPPARFRSIKQSWDTAGKGTVLSDWACCTTWGETENGFYLLDVLRAQLDYPTLKRYAKSQYAKWQPSEVLIEDKSSGEALIQDLLAEPGLFMPIIAINPTTDKITRAAAASPLIEAGFVYLPENAPWLPDYEVELSNFPNVVNDDQTDSTSQYLTRAKWPEFKPQIRTL